MLNSKKIKELKALLNNRTLVAVTKYASNEEMDGLIEQGIIDFGENRVHILQEKIKRYSDDLIRWHFIGHLQSKKVKSIINDIYMLHALDRVSLLEQIQKYRTSLLPCFIEVNISNEESKYGLKPEEVIAFYEMTKKYDKIKVIGLMGMASHTENQEMIRTQFQVLVDLKKQINDKHGDHSISDLSMGMSNDYPIALSMGSTFLRIGSVLFEEER